MDLLLEIKKFYELLTTYTNRDAAKLEDIEKAAEAVFNGKWKILTDLTRSIPNTALKRTRVMVVKLILTKLRR